MPARQGLNAKLDLHSLPAFLTLQPQLSVCGPSSNGAALWFLDIPSLQILRTLCAFPTTHARWVSLYGNYFQIAFTPKLSHYWGLRQLLASKKITMVGQVSFLDHGCCLLKSTALLSFIPHAGLPRDSSHVGFTDDRHGGNCQPLPATRWSKRCCTRRPSDVALKLPTKCASPHGAI